jgi:hypothetical protein
MMSVATMEPKRDSPVLSGAEHKVWPKRQSWRCKTCSERAVTQLGRFAGQNQASDRWLALLRSQNRNYSFPAPPYGP